MEAAVFIVDHHPTGQVHPAGERDLIDLDEGVGRRRLDRLAAAIAAAPIDANYCFAAFASPTNATVR